MVWRKLGSNRYASYHSIGLTLSCSKLEIRSDIIAQLVFCKQVLPPDVLSRVTIGKYVAVLVCNNNCANIVQRLLNRL